MQRWVCVFRRVEGVSGNVAGCVEEGRCVEGVVRKDAGGVEGRGVSRWIGSPSCHGARRSRQVFLTLHLEIEDPKDTSRARETGGRNRSASPINSLMTGSWTGPPRGSIVQGLLAIKDTHRRRTLR